jgi:hypothetical protein
MDTNSTGGAITAVVATGLMAVVIIQFISFIKSIAARDWNAAVTQVLVVLVALGAIQLFANSSFGIATIPGLDVPVEDLSFTDSLIAALALFGAGGFLYDRTKARDNTQTAAQPSLLPGPKVNEAEVPEG